MGVEISFSADRKVQQTITANRWFKFIRQQKTKPTGVWCVGGWAAIRRPKKRLPLAFTDVFYSEVASRLEAKQN